VIDFELLGLLGRDIVAKTVDMLGLIVFEKALKTLRKMAGCGWDGPGC
jgi:hypothetical protein